MSVGSVSDCRTSCRVTRTPASCSALTASAGVTFFPSLTAKPMLTTCSPGFARSLPSAVRSAGCSPAFLSTGLRAFRSSVPPESVGFVPLSVSAVRLPSAPVVRSACCTTPRASSIVWLDSAPFLILSNRANASGSSSFMSAGCSSCMRPSWANTSFFTAVVMESWLSNPMSFGLPSHRVENG